MPPRPTEVTLSLDDCEPNALPPVCCKCGAEATCEKDVKFKWVTPWVYATALAMPLITLILVLALQKKRTAFMPVCNRHSGVWNWGGPIIAFTFAAMFMLMFSSLFILAAIDRRDSAGVTSPLFMASVAVMVVGLAVGALVGVGAPLAKPITDDDMKLYKLNPAFAEAVEAQQDAEDDAYAAKRAARKPA